MSPRQFPITVSSAVRAVFATGTLLFLLAAVLVRDDPRLYAASGALGIIWWSWDLLLQHVFLPAGHWLWGVFTGEVGTESLPDIRPTLQDTIRLLENHLKQKASRHVQIHAAIRLEEIYRTIKKDPANAERVIGVIRKRYPDAPELDQYDRETRSRVRREREEGGGAGRH